ncbi:hypothetical protein M2175_004168 [Bradyrhizobium elkanii]|uniref:hypothetical protein n=1 Tax=Bradyrhizobium TaxID=374 RepID=UPI00216A3D04|nr:MULTISPECIES: hypothetical protein [Bradyrhizobium]MCS3929137.1 hypothetical protein [Bradyrhizobium elkanii]MCS3969693.1 hypothetical protein [Bradyrhizobium japonicum]
MSIDDVNSLHGNERPTNAVILPCEPDQFRDFIAGLLGKPQTITRRLLGPFEVTKPELENLHHLIEQRIVSQNEATLVQFTASLSYDDNSSVLLNSLYDFQIYKEVKPLVSKAVTLSWTYLIKFRNKKFPERQQVDITFRSRREAGYFDEVEGEVGISAKQTASAIRFQISHTDRTWGTDIESLLTGQLSTFEKREYGLRNFVYLHSGIIGFSAFAVLFLSALGAAFYATGGLIDKYLAQAKQLAASNQDSSEFVIRKLDFLIDIIASGFWTRYAFFLLGFVILALIASIFGGALIGSSAGTIRPSFVLLTPRAEEMRDVELRRYRSNWLMFSLALAGTLIVAIFGNYLFYKLSQMWSL